VEVLSELLSQSEIQEIPFTRFTAKSFKIEQKPTVKGVAYGKKDAPTIGSVKAVTYHELSVKEEKEKVTIRVLLDI
ncbi:MAG: archease, partial [Candidatus Micrarchaeota archaeon]